MTLMRAWASSDSVLPVSASNNLVASCATQTERGVREGGWGGRGQVRGGREGGRDGEKERRRERRKNVCVCSQRRLGARE